MREEAQKFKEEERWVCMKMSCSMRRYITSEEVE